VVSARDTRTYTHTHTHTHVSHTHTHTSSSRERERERERERRVCRLQGISTAARLRAARRGAEEPMETFRKSGQDSGEVVLIKGRKVVFSSSRDLIKNL